METTTQTMAAEREIGGVLYRCAQLTAGRVCRPSDSQLTFSGRTN